MLPHNKILPCPNCDTIPILHYTDIKHYTGSQFWGARYFRYICPHCAYAGYPKTEYKNWALRNWNLIASGKRKNLIVHLTNTEKTYWFPVTNQKERHFGVCCDNETEFCVSNKYRIL